MKKNLVFLFIFGLLVAYKISFAEKNNFNQFSNNNKLSKRGQDIQGSIFFENRLRTYILHLPPKYNKKNQYPLVIVLHGGGGNAEKASYMTGFSQKADEENFVVVYPNGLGRFRNQDFLLTWNAGNCCGYALDSDSNDTGFIEVLIDKLIAENNIDPKKVYVTGMSNGGMMSYRLGCELAHKITAIAPVAGALNINCNPSEPISLIVFHGTEDKHVLYEGGKPIISRDNHERVDNSVKYAIDFWTKNNGCNPIPTRRKIGTEGSVIIDTYWGCLNNTVVELYTLVGEGHTWPGGKKGRRLADDLTNEISATDLIWDFFKANPKR